MTITTTGFHKGLRWSAHESWAFIALTTRRRVKGDVSRNSISKLRWCELQPLKLSESSKYCIMHQSIPATPPGPPPPTPPPPPPPLIPGHYQFFLGLVANSRGWGLLSCQITQGGDEKRGQKRTACVSKARE